MRSAWPTLTIQGASYSENASHRLLIVNGQVLHEGETVAPELVLEEIRLKLAVFRFRGQRVGMPY